MTDPINETEISYGVIEEMEEDFTTINMYDPACNAILGRPEIPVAEYEKLKPLQERYFDTPYIKAIGIVHEDEVIIANLLDI